MQFHPQPLRLLRLLLLPVSTLSSPPALHFICFLLLDKNDKNNTKNQDEDNDVSTTARAPTSQQAATSRAAVATSTTVARTPSTVPTTPAIVATTRDGDNSVAAFSPTTSQVQVRFLARAIQSTLTLPLSNSPSLAPPSPPAQARPLPFLLPPPPQTMAQASALSLVMPPPLLLVLRSFPCSPSGSSVAGAGVRKMQTSTPLRSTASPGSATRQ
jgi:hypothetical protein